MYPAIWRDELGEDHNSSVGKQFTHFRNPANVLLTILWTETEVLVETYIAQERGTGEGGNEGGNEGGRERGTEGLGV